MGIGEKLKGLRISKSYSQKEVADLLNVGRSTYAGYEGDTSEPNFDILKKIADLYVVTIDYLLSKTNNGLINNDYVRIPVLGKIPAGVPIEAVQEIVGFEDIPKSMTTGGREYFGLKVRGDSMNPLIQDGDVIIIKKQSFADSGQLVAILVNGNEATLKRIKRMDDAIALIPENSQYQIQIYSAKQIVEMPIIILGVVVELRRSIH